MVLFWLIAAAMLIIALIAILPALTGLRWWRRAKQPDLGAAKEALLDLETQRSNGDIDEATYTQRRSDIGARLAEVVSHEPAGPATPNSAKWSAAVFSMVFCAGCVGLYFWLGSPVSLTASTVQPTVANQQQAPGSIDEMVATLADRLAANPNDPDGWMMLGRSYFVLERFREAREAYARAHVLIGDEPNLLADFAEATALSSGNRLEGEPEALIARALSIDPNHQKSLWLAGFAELQRGNNPGAVSYWETLLGLLPPQSEQIAVINDMINRAGGSTATSTGVEPEVEAAEGSVEPAFLVRVSMDPDLAGKINGNETLFVFAKAVNGPPMPLAIQKTTANALPLEVRLDDTMGMIPAFKLSTFPEVTVGARISRSGVATAQSGDLQGLSSPLTVDGTQSVEVVITEEIH